MYLRHKYTGFTLIEMLLVMAIFMIIFGIGISAFSGLRTTIQMNQHVEDIKQNIRWAQRSAALLKREPGENWIYGIGLDLRYLYTAEEYAVFKWCADEGEYNDTPHAQSRFPAHDTPDTEYGYDLANRGKIPFDVTVQVMYIEGNYCDPLLLPTNEPRGRLALLPTSGSGAVAGNGPQGQWLVEAPLRVGFDNTIVERGAQPTFILFESVTGNVFFYNQNGKILNYEDNGTPEPDPNDLRFVIATPNGDRGQMITVAHDSGKVTVELIDAETIQSDFAFTPPLGEDDDEDPPVVWGPPVSEVEDEEIDISPPDLL